MFRKTAPIDPRGAGDLADGPRIQGILRDMERREIQTGAQGKGQSVWIALGNPSCPAARSMSSLCTTATSSATIESSCRPMEPTANPYNDLQFCKKDIIPAFPAPSAR